MGKAVQRGSLYDGAGCQAETGRLYRVRLRCRYGLCGYFGIRLQYRVVLWAMGVCFGSQYEFGPPSAGSGGWAVHKVNDKQQMQLSIVYILIVISFLIGLSIRDQFTTVS